MWLVIVIVLLAVAFVCLDIRDKKQGRENPPIEEFTDMAQFNYDEKIRKYKDDYFINDPIIRIRF